MSSYSPSDSHTSPSRYFEECFSVHFNAFNDYETCYKHSLCFDLSIKKKLEIAKLIVFHPLQQNQLFSAQNVTVDIASRILD